MVCARQNALTRAVPQPEGYRLLAEKRRQTIACSQGGVKYARPEIDNSLSSGELRV
jgi:hypothetical protein